MNEFMTIEEYLESKGNPESIRVIEENNGMVVEIHQLTNSSFKYSSIVHNIENTFGDSFLMYNNSVVEAYNALITDYGMKISNNVRDLTDEEVATSESSQLEAQPVEVTEDLNEVTADEVVAYTVTE